MEIKDPDFNKRYDAFEKIFKMYFKTLHGYAFHFLNDNSAATEAVQQVFYKIWERGKDIYIHTSLKAYLYKSVYNECMLQIKKQKNMETFKAHLLNQDINKKIQGASEKLEKNQLEFWLHIALDKLPEQCRIIFILNRFEGLRYQEIAVEMNLSVKTIENQMGKALKRLRVALAEFLPLLIFYYAIFKN